VSTNDESGNSGQPQAKRVEERVVAPDEVRIEVSPTSSRSMPPALPQVPANPSLVPAVAVAPLPAPKQQPRAPRIPWVLLASVLLIAGGVAGAALRMELVPAPIRKVVIQMVKRVNTPTPAALVEVPAEVASSSEPSGCLAAHFPEGTFKDTAQLSFVCSEADAWQITNKLQKVIVAQGPTEGAALWEKLGRYDLAASVLLRTRCCTVVSPVKADVANTECGTLAAPLNALGAEPDAERLASYEKTVRCLLDHQVWLPAHYTQVADKSMQEAVEAFFEIPAGKP
jgi:hypothetical protein